jgi:hypothetical protein
MMKCRPWEIWLATVQFEDRAEVKKRPVLIAGKYPDKLYRIKMTKTPARDHFEYELKDWEQAGLKHPTTIRTSKLSDLRESDLIHKIGELSIRDIGNFKEKYIAYTKERNPQFGLLAPTIF